MAKIVKGPALSGHKVVITRNELGKYFNIFQSQSLLSIPGQKFAYFMAKNNRKLQEELDKQKKFHQQQLNIRGKLSQKYIDIEHRMLVEYSDKDENQNPITNNGEFKIANEKIDDFYKNLEIAMKEAKILKEYMAVKSFNNTMEEYFKEEVEITFHEILQDDIPESITGSQYILIEEFIR